MTLIKKISKITFKMLKRTLRKLENTNFHIKRLSVDEINFILSLSLLHNV